MRSLASLMAVAFVAAACGGGGGNATRSPGTVTVAPSTTATVAPSTTSAPASGSSDLPTAEELCALLTSADWGQFNFVTAAQPEVEDEGAGSAYCTYAGESGAEGGLELDAFVHTTVAEAEETFDLISSGADGGRAITLPGADEVFIHPAIDDKFGAIVVRTGRFTYTVSLPTGEQAEAQLLALAGTVLARSTNLR